MDRALHPRVLAAACRAARRLPTPLCPTPVALAAPQPPSPPHRAHRRPPFSSRQVPSLCEDLLSSIDQPLKIAKDKESGQDYLLCDYNRDGDSYRLGAAAHKGCTAHPAGHCSHPLYLTPSSSPWSNTYDPPLDDGAMPSARLRELEIQVGRGVLHCSGPPNLPLPRPPAGPPVCPSTNMATSSHLHTLAPPHHPLLAPTRRPTAPLTRTASCTLRVACRPSTSGTSTTALPVSCSSRRVCLGFFAPRLRASNPPTARRPHHCSLPLPPTSKTKSAMARRRSRAAGTASTS